MLIYIYKIENTIDDKVYVGGTKQKLSYRFNNHKHEAIRGCRKTISQHIRELGYDKFFITELERKEVEDIQQKCMAEQEWINTLQPALNDIRAYRSPADWKEGNHKYYIANKEKIRVRQKIYDEEHKEQLDIASKKYYNEHKEKWTECRNRNKDIINSRRRTTKIRAKANAYVKKRAQDAIATQKFKCERCSICYGVKRSLQRHIKIKHS